MNGRTVTRQELDDALAAQRIRLGRTNRRPARCCLEKCPWLGNRQSGHSWKLYVDGHYRGFICEDCWPPGGFIIERPATG